jgi:hypothetical protein
MPAAHNAASQQHQVVWKQPLQRRQGARGTKQRASNEQLPKVERERRCASDDAVGRMFQLLDRDRDGFLSRSEYKAFCLRTESRDLDDARWAAHCGPDGLRVADPSAGISRAEFDQLFTSRSFPRHFNKAEQDLDTLQGGSVRRSQQRQRAVTAHTVANRHGLGAGRCSPGVQSCVAMQSLPQPHRAQALLERLARQAAPEMRRRGWHVGVLREFLPRQASLEGLNYGHGQEIKIRLRDGQGGGFVSYERLLLTLLHELAHIEVTAHDGAFFQLLSELVRGCGVPGVYDCYIRQRAVSWACAGCCGGGSCGANALAAPAPTVSRQNLQQLFEFSRAGVATR